MAKISIHQQIHRIIASPGQVSASTYIDDTRFERV
jgi:hypothetical protein